VAASQVSLLSARVMMQPEGLPALLVLVLMMVPWRWALSKSEIEWRAQGAGDETWLGGDGEAWARRRRRGLRTAVSMPAASYP
jgi:hypothetical protein